MRNNQMTPPLLMSLPSQAASMILPGYSVTSLTAGLLAVSASVLALVGSLGSRLSPKSQQAERSQLDSAASFVIGATFASGLVISGMTLPAKVWSAYLRCGVRTGVDLLVGGETVQAVCGK